jgi:hypothetical protein
MAREETMIRKNYYVKRGGRVPQDVVEVTGRASGEVTFFPSGGGFQYHMPGDAFDAMHREVTPDEYAAPTAYRATYDIDGVFGGLPGYSFGRRWNGWACPYFPKESCDRIVAAIGKRACYDAATSSYLIPYDDGGDDSTEFDTYAAQQITVDGRVVTVWAIGNGSWTWDEER